jgi:hypothetical protein
VKEKQLNAKLVIEPSAKPETVPIEKLVVNVNKEKEIVGKENTKTKPAVSANNKRETVGNVSVSAKSTIVGNVSAKRKKLAANVNVGNANIHQWLYHLR